MFIALTLILYLLIEDFSKGFGFYIFRNRFFFWLSSSNLLLMSFSMSVFDSWFAFSNSLGDFCRWGMLLRDIFGLILNFRMLSKIFSCFSFFPDKKEIGFLVGFPFLWGFLGILYLLFSSLFLFRFVTSFEFKIAFLTTKFFLFQLFFEVMLLHLINFNFGLIILILNLFEALTFIRLF
jgi:hypothetical protein